MFTLDFFNAISGYIFLVLFLALGLGFLENRQRPKKISLDERFIWFCSVCSYTYVNTKEEIISLCPRCGSYNKKEDSRKNN